MSEYCVEINNITKKFGKFTAVDSLSVKLLPGKVYGFIGPNGAGKSTTMGMIMGTVVPTSGNGTVMGHPIGSSEALSYLGYSPEFTSFYTDMSCLEYLWYMGTLSGLNEKKAMDRAYELIEKFDLTAFADKKVAKFSTGMKKKVSLAQAMIHNPKVLLLDEPTANLDPTSRMEILETVKEMASDSQTVLISSHVLTELETVVDHVIMIDHGHLIMDAEINEAQEKFKHGILLVSTSNDQQIMDLLKDRYSCQLEESGLRFETKNMEQLKKDIVRAVYENDLDLNMLKEEVLSLDMLYQEVLKEEKAQ